MVGIPREAFDGARVSLENVGDSGRFEVGDADGLVA